MTHAGYTDRPSGLTDDQIRHIFVEVAMGTGNHGGFLRSFAETLDHADFPHFGMLRDVACQLIKEYGLQAYL